MVHALEETVLLALEVVGIPEASVALVQVEAAVLDQTVQVAAAMEVAWAEVLEQAQEELVTAAIMDPVGALAELAQQVLAVAPEAWEEATAVGTAVSSNNNKVSSQSHGKLHEEFCRQNCAPCE